MAKIIIINEGEKYMVANATIRTIDERNVWFFLPKNKKSIGDVLAWVKMGVFSFVGTSLTDDYHISVDSKKVENIISE